MSLTRRAAAAPAADVEGELGDLLFVLVNLARFVKVDPEQALRKTNAKFRQRLRICREEARRAWPLNGAEFDRRNGVAVAGSQKVSDSAARPRGDSAAISIRALTTQKEFADAVQLQREIWGFNDLELLPVRLFVVASKVGGQTLGAFDGDRMIGFLPRHSGSQTLAAVPTCTATCSAYRTNIATQAWAVC